MKNVDRLAQLVTKHGDAGLMVHTIPGTSNWLVCNKIEEDKWAITLCNPMGVISYNLGVVTDAQHLQIWRELIWQDIERKTSQLRLAQELKQTISYFIKQYEKENKKSYKNFRKIETKGKKAKSKPKSSKGLKGTKSPHR